MPYASFRSVFDHGLFDEGFEIVYISGDIVLLGERTVGSDRDHGLLKVQQRERGYILLGSVVSLLLSRPEGILDLLIFLRGLLHLILGPGDKYNKAYYKYRDGYHLPYLIFIDFGKDHASLFVLSANMRDHGLFGKGETMLNRKKQRLVAGIICGILILAMVFGLVATIGS